MPSMDLPGQQNQLLQDVLSHGNATLMTLEVFITHYQISNTKVNKCINFVVINIFSLLTFSKPIHECSDCLAIIVLLQPNIPSSYSSSLDVLLI